MHCRKVWSKFLVQFLFFLGQVIICTGILYNWEKEILIQNEEKEINAAKNVNHTCLCVDFHIEIITSKDSSYLK